MLNHFDQGRRSDKAHLAVSFWGPGEAAGKEASLAKPSEPKGSRELSKCDKQQEGLRRGFAGLEEVRQTCLDSLPLVSKMSKAS